MHGFFPAKTSGTTVTFVIIEGWVITVASVGDSRCIFESAEGGIYYLSADHRLECNEEERERITTRGGEIGRLNAGSGAEVSPLPLQVCILMHFEFLDYFFSLDS
ncbi:probable protein phosphatase 2C 12 [Hibiscus syriacus]|uniref:probable protein phosphatase 2C 12 n=1 Tax=Hibiscus syriacus TaxID=106335 RepID=UPI0019228CBE|nr:probable protein phosphatase 2C 12 [Hibiscus syriacus]